jgi:hypothetical protein
MISNLVVLYALSAALALGLYVSASYLAILYARTESASNGRLLVISVFLNVLLTPLSTEICWFNCEDIVLPSGIVFAGILEALFTGKKVDDDHLHFFLLPVITCYLLFLVLKHVKKHNRTKVSS